MSIPEKTHVLVIGGGPGGSTAAALLARQGYEVTLLEQSFFPRYHIGESLLPSILQIMDLIGAREKMDAYGFQRKEGAFLEWGREKWPLNFGELSGNCTYAFQVIRSEFDQMLLDHAGSLGAKVFQGIEVRSLKFDDHGRPVSASWQKRKDSGTESSRDIHGYGQTSQHSNNNGGSNGNGHNNGHEGSQEAAEQGEIQFKYLIDASGRSGVMATRYLRSRRYHKVFQNIAIWGYWENADRLATGREGDIAVSSIPNGWLWAIPLHDGKMSVGVVMHREAVNARRGKDLKEVYMDVIQEAGLVKNIVGNAQMISPIHSEADYSYTSEQFSGPGFFIVGDAACFLDPLLSSGVHLATFSAMLAAASISSLEHGEINASEACNFFEKSYRQAYLRFLVFLSAFYDVNRGKESYFWEAQRLTQEDVDSTTLKQAFLTLVTGLKDLKDATTDTHHLILNEMSRRIDENLHMRQDKESLEKLDEVKVKEARANANFFSSVEGIFSLNKEEAIDGLYVETEPRLRLARA